LKTKLLAIISPH